MNSPRNALGRGIGALIPTSPLPPPVPPAAGYEPARDARASAHEVAVAAIDPNPDQPRRVFESTALQTLSESIRVHGVLQPIVVRRAGDRYELVVGERRWRAAKLAGLETIPAAVLEIDTRDRLEVALIENVQRRDLNPIELAVAFRALADTGATQEEIGERVGMDRSSVANHLRLLDLSRELQTDVEEARLTIGHAKALLAVATPERRRALRDRIVEQQLSVRAAEQLARPSPPAASGGERARAVLDPHLQGVADSLRQHLQTRVRVKGGAERGRIEIEYFGPEDFERITAALLGDV